MALNHFVSEIKQSKTIDNNNYSFIPLYSDPYNEDRHSKFEKGLNCLQGNLREIINYLALFPDTFPDLKKNSNDIFEKNFFYSFVQFNQLIFKFMEKQRTFEEIFSN